MGKTYRDQPESSSQRNKKNKMRSRIAFEALDATGAGPHKDKRIPRGGSKNSSREYFEEWEDYCQDKEEEAQEDYLLLEEDKAYENYKEAAKDDCWDFFEPSEDPFDDEEEDNISSRLHFITVNQDTIIPLTSSLPYIRRNRS